MCWILVDPRCNWKNADLGSKILYIHVMISRRSRCLTYDCIRTFRDIWGKQDFTPERFFNQANFARNEPRRHKNNATVRERRTSYENCLLSWFYFINKWTAILVFLVPNQLEITACIYRCLSINSYCYWTSWKFDLFMNRTYKSFRGTYERTQDYDRNCST